MKNVMNVQKWIFLFVVCCLATVSAQPPPPCLNVTTWNGRSWDFGIPDGGTIAVFNGDFTSMADMIACEVIVSAGADVVFNNTSSTEGHTLTVFTNVDVNSGGSLTFEDNASLVQLFNSTNSGQIIYRRETSPITKFDFTYWSSPVSPQTLLNLSPNTLFDKYFEFQPTFSPVSQFTSIPSSTTMTNGKGLLCKG